MTRLVRGLSLSAVLLVSAMGCSLVIGETQPKAGQLLEDGSLLLGSGTIGEESWVYVIGRRGDQLCTSASIAGRNVAAGNCTSAAELRMGMSGTSSTNDGRIVVIDGFTAVAASTLRLEGGGMLADYPVVSLAPLGAQGYAFGMVLPEVPALTMTLIDANGRVTERNEMRFR